MTCKCHVMFSVVLSHGLDVVAQLAYGEIPYSYRVSNILRFYMGCFP